MHACLIEMLGCPVCHSELEWEISRREIELGGRRHGRAGECVSTGRPVLPGSGSGAARGIQIGASIVTTSSWAGTRKRGNRQGVKGLAFHATWSKFQS